MKINIRRVLPWVGLMFGIMFSAILGAGVAVNSLPDLPEPKGAPHESLFEGVVTLFLLPWYLLAAFVGAVAGSVLGGFAGWFGGRYGSRRLTRKESSS